MIEKAKKKIIAELEKEKDPNSKAIGDYLLQQIEINKDAEIKIVQEGKTIKGAIKEMSDIARKRAVGGMAMISDAEGFEIVRKYFGFEAVQHKMLEVEAEEVKEIISKEKSNAINVDFNVSLDDFM